MYNLTYRSILAQDFHNFVQMKRNLGYKYTTAAYLIRDLDTFLYSKNINVPVLTKELCEEWMQRRPHEAGSTYRGRCMILIEFSRFMGDIGKPSFIPRMPGIQSRGFTAHIFTGDEIRRFFASCDKLVLRSLKKDSVIIMLPALFRLLYGTGMRISEALSLKCKDVNLDENFVILHDTKNRKDRLVPISASLSDVLKEYENPERIYQAQKILSIPIKKSEKKSIRYLSVDGIRFLLRQPDRRTQAGRRDLTMLALMYDTGARVQEIADLKAECVRLEKPYTISITGKGRKTRVVPLLDKQMEYLADYMCEHNLNRPENASRYLFTNRSGNKLTRGGISYLLQKYLTMAKDKNPAIIPDGISCHSLRHSRAMHLLQADVPLIYIRDLLGHESVITTEIYAKTDSRRKREVLTNAFTPILDEKKDEKPIWLKNENLLEWLKNL